MTPGPSPRARGGATFFGMSTPHGRHGISPGALGLWLKALQNVDLRLILHYSNNSQQDAMPLLCTESSIHRNIQWDYMKYP